PSWVERFGARRLVVVVRYDRRRERDGTWRRVHQEDLCQALGLPPERKYQSDGGPTPRDIAERLRAVVEPRAAVEDVQQFADALLFNWLVVGTDAHAKNYSLLLPAGGRVRLAPRYDLGSMIPYEDPLACKLAMKLGGEYRIKAISAGVHLPVLASHLGDDAERLRLRAAGLARALPDALADAAREAGALDDPVAIALRDGVSAHTRRLFPAPRTGGS
ncbi:MAG TPA: HipA domain-containing protein, partial [Nitriliruptorales bacterium]